MEVVVDVVVVEVVIAGAIVDEVVVVVLVVLRSIVSVKRLSGIISINARGGSPVQALSAGTCRKLGGTYEGIDVVVVVVVLLRLVTAR